MPRPFDEQPELTAELFPSISLSLRLPAPPEAGILIGDVTRRLRLATLPACPLTLLDRHPVLVVERPGQRRNYGPVRRLKKYEQANRLLAAAAAQPLTVAQACRTAQLGIVNLSPVLHRLVADGKIRRPIQNRPLDIIDPSPYDLDLLGRGLRWAEVQDLAIGDYVAIRRPLNAEKPIVLDLADELGGEPFLARPDYLYYGAGSPMYLEIWDYLCQNPDTRHQWGQRRSLCQQKGWTAKAYESAQNSFRYGADKALSFPRFLAIDAQFAALCGYWVAEGSATRTSVDWASHTKEESYRTEIADALEGLIGRRGSTYYIPGTHGCSHAISCKPLARLLPLMFGDNAREKHLPEWWIDLPAGVLCAFLRALFNGDGCCFQSGPRRRISLKTTSLTLAWQVRQILLKLGTNGSIIEHAPQVSQMKTGQTIRSGTSYSVNINGAAATRLAGWLGYSFIGSHNGSNHTRWFMDDQYVYLRVDSIS